MFLFITLISMEFNNLQIKFIDLKYIKATEIETHLKSLVQRHEKLFECSEKLEKIFSPSFLFNFVQSSFVICLTAFQSSTSSEASQLFFNFTYCTAVLNQIWLLCFFGQKVINSSECIAMGAYDSGWENIKSIRVKKAVLNIVRRAQIPIKLTAMKFKEISLKSFTTVKSINYLSACNFMNYSIDSSASIFILYIVTRILQHEVKVKQSRSWMKNSATVFIDAAVIASQLELYFITLWLLTFMLHNM